MLLVCSQDLSLQSRISRLRLFRKTLRVLLEYHIYTELMVDGKEIERINYSPLAMDV